ncbi:hypothetical protein [Nostoc sp.]|uniref:hypothetical protein n=1 Tax=Nostoc sp. TaxID=1180 RepID=UPI002FF7D566
MTDNAIVSADNAIVPADNAIVPANNAIVLIDNAIVSRDLENQTSLSFLSPLTTVLSLDGHAVAHSNQDLKALLSAATAISESGFLLPTRNTELLRWCLERGLHIVRPMTLMSMGLYNEPVGAFLPSIFY